MKNFLKNFCTLIILVSLPFHASVQASYGDDEFVHSSVRLIYFCELDHKTKQSWVEVTIDPSNLVMEVKLEEGTTTRGHAVVTSEPRNRVTTYFLQGSSAPLAQQFSLVIGPGDDSAEFTRAHGAAIFTCRRK